MSDNVVMTDMLKSRFCKDMSLPIKVVKEPYFTHFLELYDPIYGCLAEYEKFKALVEKYGGQNGFMQAYDALKDAAINFLKENEKMKFFSQEEDMQKFAVKNVGYPKSDIFNDTNIGKFFVSIDMKKANFTALHSYDPSIVGYKDTYEEFLRMFTDEDYFVNSKYIRQVIFGNINPKRQSTYEAYLMDQILSDILKKFEEKGFDTSNLVAFFHTDEIVLRVDDKFLEDKETGKEISVGLDSSIQLTKTISSDFVSCLEDIVADYCAKGVNVRATYFQLRKIGGTKGYVKMFDRGEKVFDFKCVDAIDMPFVCRYFLGECWAEMDKVFMFEGRLCNLIDIPNISVV